MRKLSSNINKDGFFNQDIPAKNEVVVYQLNKGTRDGQFITVPGTLADVMSSISQINEDPKKTQFHSVPLGHNMYLMCEKLDTLSKITSDRLNVVLKKGVLMAIAEKNCLIYKEPYKFSHRLVDMTKEDVKLAMQKVTSAVRHENGRLEIIQNPISTKLNIDIPKYITCHAIRMKETVSKIVNVPAISPEAACKYIEDNRDSDNSLALDKDLDTFTSEISPVEEEFEEMQLSGNKGWDIFDITDHKDGTVHLKSGSCGVITINRRVPVELLSATVEKMFLEYGSVENIIDSFGWDEEFKQELKEKCKPIMPSLKSATSQDEQDYDESEYDEMD